MVSLESLVLLVFCDLFSFDLLFFIKFVAWPCHFICGVAILLVFHGFPLVFFLFLNFIF